MSLRWSQVTLQQPVTVVLNYLPISIFRLWVCVFEFHPLEDTKVNLLADEQITFNDTFVRDLQEPDYKHVLKCQSRFSARTG